jgi:hypothetical protein
MGETLERGGVAMLETTIAGVMIEFGLGAMESQISQ